MTVLDTKRLPALDDPITKLEHGRRHLDALDAAIKAYVESPDSFGYDAVRQEGGGFVYRMWQRKPPPKDIALICGDAVHNMRCALDYLVRQLGIADSQKVSDKSEFPILLDAGKDDQRWHSAAGRALSLLSAPHIEEIRKLQPFLDRTPNSQNVILQNLDAFESIDKHNLPVVVSAAATSAEIKATGAFRKVTIRRIANGPVALSEEPVDLYWLNAWGPSDTADMHQLTNIAIRFLSADGPPAPALRKMAETVGMVIGSFAVDVLTAASHRRQESG